MHDGVIGEGGVGQKSVVPQERGEHRLEVETQNPLDSDHLLGVRGGDPGVLGTGRGEQVVHDQR
jgi:hypothetical protein